MRPRDGRYVLTALALMAAGWGLLGWLDLPDRGQAGFETDGIHRITLVRPGSAAEAAGLKTGDRITRFDGVDARNAKTLSHLPPKRPGDRQTLTVERVDEELQLTVTYGPVGEGERSIIRASLLVGCGFIFFPLLAFLRRPNEATRVLTLMGTGLGLAHLDGPMIEDFSVRAISGSIITLFVLFGFATMVRFLIMFPPPRAGVRGWFSGPYSRRLIYIPAILLWLLLAWRLLFTPEGTSVLNVFTQALAGVVMGTYLLGSLYRFLRNYSRTDRAQRDALALNGMLWGTVAGVLPGLVAALAESFSPEARLPGQDFYFISLVLLPLTWARSAARVSTSQPPVANGISES